MEGWTDGAQILKSHLVSTWVCELVHNDTILDAVENLIGPDILCWAATFFAKEPETDSYVGWHQDIHYWGLEPAEQVATVWLGLTDAHRDNGGMFCIPGSHQGETRTTGNTRIVTTCYWGLSKSISAQMTWHAVSRWIFNRGNSRPTTRVFYTGLMATCRNDRELDYQSITFLPR